MSNSSLVNYTAMSPYKTSPRKKTIDAVIVHCMAGNFSVETLGNIFQRPNKNASSTYGIGSDGRIGQYVDEKDRAWCSGGTDKNKKIIRVNGISGADWDQRAISIEVANDGGAPDWHVSDKALESLVNLLVDICQRNGIKKLLWKNDKTLVGKIDQQNMALHRWFSTKSCPGNYLVSKHAFIMEQVNSRLNGEKPVDGQNTQAEQYYTVVKGDTMTKIAIKFNTFLPELKRLNPQIKNISLIIVGQKIRVK